MRAIPDTSLVDAAFRPAMFIRTRPDIRATNRRGKVRVAFSISVFYLLNVVVYAIPVALLYMSLTRFNLQDAVTIVALPFLSISGFTFWTFHLGLLLTGNSGNMLESYQTVVYSTGIYLAGYLGYLYPVLLPNIRQDTLGYFFDFGAVTTYYAGQLFLIPFRLFDVIAPLRLIEVLSRLSSFDFVFIPLLRQQVNPGTIAIAGLLASYYTYSIYLGARLRHGATRLESLVTVATTITAPIFAVVVFARISAGMGQYVLGIIGVMVGIFVFDVALRKG